MNKEFDPTGMIKEDELIEVTEAKDANGAGTPAVTIPIITAVSSAFCPTTKCSSKC